MLIRLCTLTHSESAKIRMRQKKGRMKEFFDSENYLCFDSEEYENWVPKKNGRPPKKTANEEPTV